ncbi:acetyl-CoA C-acetyltransferase [Alicyclobacillaceae bacterium I2511]|nr:acetyl-CoA C-acetyltransferase [Alicyclobacillaceae bacterium I2511]
MTDNDVVIVGAARTAIGNFLGGLSSLSAAELGSIAISAAVQRSGVDPGEIGEVFLGNVLQAGLGQNPARQAAMKAGLDQSIPDTTVNMVCGSGLKAVMLADLSIRAGENGVVLAGGMESMSNAPYLLQKARQGYRMGPQTVEDVLIKDGLWCAFVDAHMGITAENVAEKFHVSRQEQDEFSALSQEKALQAIASGRFKEEIVPVSIPQKKGDPKWVDTDEFPRAGTTAEVLAKLRPAFKQGGTVTAGNASGINDGAAALMLCSGERARTLGLRPMARIVSYASVGLDPAYMGLGPIEATRKALRKANLDLSQIDLVEVNEAFASQSIVVLKELGLNQERVNVNGGAVALGHPIGASGSRILVTLLYEMEKRDLQRGLATLCIGGGQGVAMIVERG